jgi:hypothetical protein
MTIISLLDTFMISIFGAISGALIVDFISRTKSERKMALLEGIINHDLRNIKKELKLVHKECIIRSHILCDVLATNSVDNPVHRTPSIN